MNITDNTELSRSKNIPFSEIDDELVMMDLEQGKYYGLNSVGSSIWTLLSEPITFGKLCDELQLEYKVERDECQKQVKEFVTQLLKSKLVNVK